MRRFLLPLFSFILLLALVACGQQTADRGPWTATPTVDHGPWTATSTVYRPPSTVYPPPSTVTPSPEPITLAKTFGLTGDALKAFAGAERYITRAEDGSYLVTAQVRNQETGELEEVQYALDPTSFNTHPEITNPLSLDTLQAKDADGNPVTLLWLPETHEFRLAYDLLPIVDLNTIGTEKPKAIKENLASIPEIPIEDIQNGLAARCVLLAMERDGYKPFGPEAVEAWKKLGGYYLHFEEKNGLKWVELRSYVNLTRSSDYHPQENTLPEGVNSINFNSVSAKFAPYLFKTPDGRVISTLTLFNPKDPQNPNPDEFLITFGIVSNGNPLSDFDFSVAFKTNNPLMLNRAFLYATNDNLDPNDPNTIVIPNPANPDQPTLLDKNDPLQSLLAQLLQIKGNDASQIDETGKSGIFDMKVNINWWINQLKKNGDVAEVPFDTDTIPPELQLMLFLFEVGVAQ